MSIDNCENDSHSHFIQEGDAIARSSSGGENARVVVRVGGSWCSVSVDGSTLRGIFSYERAIRAAKEKAQDLGEGFIEVRRDRVDVERVEVRAENE